MRVRRKVSSGLRRCSNLLYKAASHLYRPPESSQARQVVPWFAIQGDETLRLEYDLNENSVVFDLGGYEGQWSSDIFARYCCSIHIFEPVEDFAVMIQSRFSRNKKIVLHRFGLSNETIGTRIYLSKDATSIFKVTPESREISLVKASDFLEESGISNIDLMKINIEGGEYDLLDHLIDSGFVKNIENIQVQFHDFVADAERRMASIQARLTMTHFLTYQYPFVWENWKAKIHDS